MFSFARKFISELIKNKEIQAGGGCLVLEIQAGGRDLVVQEIQVEGGSKTLPICWEGGVWNKPIMGSV